MIKNIFNNTLNIIIHDKQFEFLVKGRCVNFYISYINKSGYNFLITLQMFPDTRADITISNNQLLNYLLKGEKVQYILEKSTGKMQVTIKLSSFYIWDNILEKNNKSLFLMYKMLKK